MTQICLMSLNQESNILLRRSIIFKNKDQNHFLFLQLHEKLRFDIFECKFRLFFCFPVITKKQGIMTAKISMFWLITLCYCKILITSLEKKFCELVKICYHWIIFIDRNNALIYLLNRFVRCWQWIRFWDQEKMYLFISNIVAFWY